MKRRMNIGTTSLILIFIVLCLSTFGLLSLSSARGDWNLAQKNAGAVRGYYAADAKGEAFVAMVDQTLRQAEAAGTSFAGQQDFLKEKLGDFYQEDGTVRTEIPMDFDQALSIELALTDAFGYEIRSWNVYNRVDYEIDTSIPVWTGEE